MSDVFLNEFWPVYPRKVAKAKAKRMWDKQIKAGHKPEAIIAGLKRLLPDYQRRSPDYIPYPASWLNDERWEDESVFDVVRAEVAARKSASQQFLEMKIDKASLHERVMRVDIYD